MNHEKVVGWIIIMFAVFALCLALAMHNEAKADIVKFKEISYSLPTTRESGKPLNQSEIELIRVYNQLDNVIELVKEVPPTELSTVLDDVFFACIRLSTVDKMGYEGRLSELDKSKHCFDLPGAPGDIKVRVVWELNTGE